MSEIYICQDEERALKCAIARFKLLQSRNLHITRSLIVARIVFVVGVAVLGISTVAVLIMPGTAASIPTGLLAFVFLGAGLMVVAVFVQAVQIVGSLAKLARYFELRWPELKGETDLERRAREAAEAGKQVVEP